MSILLYCSTSPVKRLLIDDVIDDVEPLEEVLVDMGLFDEVLLVELLIKEFPAEDSCSAGFSSMAMRCE